MSAHAAPLPPQSMLKHTAAVAAAAAAALDLSGRRISHRINSVFVVTSASAASEAFLFSTGQWRADGGETEGKCRPLAGADVQRQSEVEDCDWLERGNICSFLYRAAE